MLNKVQLLVWMILWITGDAAESNLSKYENAKYAYPGSLTYDHNFANRTNYHYYYYCYNDTAITTRSRYENGSESERPPDEFPRKVCVEPTIKSVLNFPKMFYHTLSRIYFSLFVLCRGCHDNLITQSCQGHKNWIGLQAPVLNPGSFGGSCWRDREHDTKSTRCAAPCPGKGDWRLVRARELERKACMCHGVKPHPAQWRPGEQEPFSDPGGSGRPNSAYAIQILMTPLKVPQRACKPGHLERWIEALNGVYTIRGAKRDCLDALKHKHPNSTPIYPGQNVLVQIRVLKNRCEARKPLPVRQDLYGQTDEGTNVDHRCLFCRCHTLDPSGLSNHILCPWPMPCVRQGHGYKVLSCIKPRVWLMHAKFNPSTTTSASSSCLVAWTLANGPSPTGVCCAWSLAFKGPAAPQWCGPGRDVVKQGGVAQREVPTTALEAFRLTGGGSHPFAEPGIVHGHLTRKSAVNGSWRSGHKSLYLYQHRKEQGRTTATKRISNADLRRRKNLRGRWHMAPYGCKERFSRPPLAHRSRPVEKVTKNPAPCSPQATLAGQLVLLLARPGGGTAPKTVPSRVVHETEQILDSCNNRKAARNAFVHAMSHDALGIKRKIHQRIWRLHLRPDGQNVAPRNLKYRRFAVRGKKEKYPNWNFYWIDIFTKDLWGKPRVLRR